jgi:hypothetical protein
MVGNASEGMLHGFPAAIFVGNQDRIVEECMSNYRAALTDREEALVPRMVRG